MTPETDVPASDVRALAVGDFNGDGNLDIAALSPGKGLVVVLLGNGRGGFGLPGWAELGTTPYAIGSGDLNGDGRPDLVVIRQAPGDQEAITISVLLASSGFPPFEAPANFGLFRPRGFGPPVVADATGDGFPDVLVLVADPDDGLQSALAILPGDGKGGLGPARIVKLGGSPQSFAVGDFDEDGRLDIATAGDFRDTEILLGRADGSFASAGFVSGTEVELAADFDLDGKLDVVTKTHSRGGGDFVYVSWGNGDGSFTPAISLDAGYGLKTSFTVADFTGDGGLDLAIAANGGLYIFPTLSGARGFGPPAIVPVSPYHVAAGDFLADGRPDLALAGGPTGVMVLLNACGAGTAEETVVVPFVGDFTNPEGTRYRTDLLLENRSASPVVTVEMIYFPSFGGGAGAGTMALAAGQQIQLPALYLLQRSGLPIPSSGNRGGSLRLRFRGLTNRSDAAAVSLVSGDQQGRRFSVALPGVSTSRTLRGASIVGPLLETAADRTNLAVVHAGFESDGELRVRVTLLPAALNGSPPDAPAATLELKLAPGEIGQLDAVLSTLPGRPQAAVARIEPIQGTAPYLAWAMLHDRESGDASYLPAVPDAVAPVPSQLAVPAVVESPSFETELLLANASDRQKTVRLDFAPDGSMVAPVRLSLAPRSVLTVPGVVDELRRQGTGLPPKGPTVAGPLVLAVEGDDARGLLAGARTAVPGGPGAFLPAVPGGLEVADEAWVTLPGYLAGPGSYTNLAISNLSDAEATFRVEVFNGLTGRSSGSVESIRVRPFGLAQLSSVLRTTAATTPQGYARVTRTSGTGSFLAYAVLMDGIGPGVGGNGDGAFIPPDPFDR